MQKNSDFSSNPRMNLRAISHANRQEAMHMKPIQQEGPAKPERQPDCPKRTPTALFSILPPQRRMRLRPGIRH